MTLTSRSVRTLASIVIISGAALCTRLETNSVLLGTVELKGQTEEMTVSAGAITINNSDPEIIGRVVNKTGFTMNDLTVEIRRVGDDNDAPTGGDAKVSRPAPSNDSSSQSGSSNGGSGTKAKVDFGGASGVGDVAPGDTLYLEIEVDSTDGDDITVHLTPSGKGMLPNANAHADLFTTYQLSSNQSASTRRLSAPGNDRAAIRVTNVDRNGYAMSDISGSISFGAGDSSTLQSVHLSHSNSTSIPPGTTILINGNSFNITGFPHLTPASSYDLVLVFSGVPAKGYGVTVAAGF